MISAEFPGNTAMPEKVEISDAIVVSDGGMKNAETAAENEIIPDIEENNFTFNLEGHETPDSYDPSRSIYRCIEITCGWGENECEYTFCVSEKPE